jgi:hypothetical protein
MRVLYLVGNFFIFPIVIDRKNEKITNHLYQYCIMTNQFFTSTGGDHPALSNAIIKQHQQQYDQALLRDAGQTLIDLYNNKNSSVQLWIQSLQLRTDIIHASMLGHGIRLLRQTHTRPDYSYHIAQFVKEFNTCRQRSDASKLQRIAMQLELFCYEYLRTPSYLQVQAWNLMQLITQQMS